jgi:hypothetical protein
MPMRAKRISNFPDARPALLPTRRARYQGLPNRLIAMASGRWWFVAVVSEREHRGATALGIGNSGSTIEA